MYDDATPHSVGGDCSTQGSVSRTFKWLPNSGQNLVSDPPPSVLQVKVHSYATAQASSSESAVILTAVINNGFSGNPGNRTTDYNSPDFKGKIMTAEGTFLVPIANNERQQVVTTPTYLLFAGGRFSGLGAGRMFVAAEMTIELAP